MAGCGIQLMAVPTPQLQLPIMRPGCHQCFWLICYKLEVPQNQPRPLLNHTLIWYNNLLEWLIVILQLFSCVWLFVTPWTAAHQASLTFTISWNSLKLMPMQWCYLTILSSVIPFSSCLQSFPASESFQHFTSVQFGRLVAFSPPGPFVHGIL